MAVALCGKSFGADDWNHLHFAVLIFCTLVVWLDGARWVTYIWPEVFTGLLSGEP